ncbi:MAG: hypothetical protein MUC92_10990 [Fimbriimonadaceae bacterium]|jgi:hypothetical protein|nr:hypothetical protein [Fimbriimonadaceae bacterium]
MGLMLFLDHEVATRAVLTQNGASKLLALFPGHKVLMAYSTLEYIVDVAFEKNQLENYANLIYSFVTDSQVKKYFKLVPLSEYTMAELLPLLTEAGSRLGSSRNTIPLAIARSLQQYEDDYKDLQFLVADKSKFQGLYPDELLVEFSQ